MKLIARRLLRNYLNALLFWIPRALVITGLVWFVVDFILSIFPIDYGHTFRLFYLIGVAIECLWLTITAIMLIWFCRQLAKRIQLPFGTITEAIVVYELHKKKPTSEWTAEWVISKIELAKAINKLADNLAKAIISG